MKKIIVTTIIAATITILLLSAVGKPQIQAEQPEKTTTTTQPPHKVVATETTPANGTVKGDKIYVCVFGWIDYEGGGGIGEVNKQMYQNGNKIGYFGGHSGTSKQTQKTKTTQPPDKAVTATTTPANGTIKDDMIYIIGFGWVENEGGGGEGTHDHEMKTNGNKIGCFG